MFTSATYIRRSVGCGHSGSVHSAPARHGKRWAQRGGKPDGKIEDRRSCGRRRETALSTNKIDGDENEEEAAGTAKDEFHQRDQDR